MTHYMVDERDVNFCLFDWLDIGKLSAYPKYAEVGYDEAMAREMMRSGLKVAREVLAPIWSAMDSDGVKFENGKVSVPEYVKKAYQTYTENGFLGLSAPPELGGLGMPHILNMGVMEFFCGANTAFSMYSELTYGAAHMFQNFASDGLRAKYVEKMYTGEWGGTMCLTEPGAGSDVGALKTKATRRPDGSFSIVGTKIFISSGDHDLTTNIIHPVLARIEGAPYGIHGISLFLVPKYLVNDDGSIGEFNDVVTGNVEHKMGIKGNATCTLNFGESGKCQGWLIGEENKGIAYMFQMMNEARLYVGMQGNALAAAAFQSALQYSKERIQFRHIKDMANNEAPPVAIIEHPDIRRMLMHMKSTTEGVRAMLAQVAFWGDLAHVTEDPEEKQHYQNLVEFLVPICKAYSTDQGFKVTELAIQTLGGYGYIKEYPMEQYMRDEKITSLYEGTNGIQALDLMGRKMTMKGGAVFMQVMQEISIFVGEHKDHPVMGEAFAKLEKAQMEMAMAVMGIQQSVKQGGFEALVPLLQASNFLEAAGHIVVSWMLLSQAVLAANRLNGMIAEKGVDANDKKAVRAFIEAGEEATYYYNKTQSAYWFVNNRLPIASAVFEMMKNKDLSAMKAIL